MMERAIGEHLTAIEVKDTGKTKVWRIDTAHGANLGYVRWWSAWRRYTFWPAHGTIFDVKCMLDIAQFINDEMTRRRKPVTTIERCPVTATVDPPRPCILGRGHHGPHRYA